MSDTQHKRQLNGQTYAFYPRQMRACTELSQEHIFAEAGCQHAAILAEGDAAAGIYGLDGSAGLECRLGGSPVCHYHSADTCADPVARRRKGSWSLNFF